MATDPVIEEMYQRIVTWGHRQIPRADWLRWASYLLTEVQPQLDELAALKPAPVVVEAPVEAPVEEKRKPGRPKRVAVGV